MNILYIEFLTRGPRSTAKAENPGSQNRNSSQSSPKHRTKMALATIDSNKGKEKELTDEKRLCVVSMMMGASIGGNLPEQFLSLVAGQVARKFGVQTRCISRLWEQANQLVSMVSW